jgi:hypothetical protein
MTMANDVFIPDNLAGGPAAIFQEQNIQTEALNEGIDGIGFGIVGIKGKEFYVRYHGRRATIVNAAGDVSKYFDFVILRKNPGKSHTWYEKGYNPGSDGSPDCVSTDGIAPDDASTKPQSELCDLCPRYEWKMQPNGRKGRACQDSLRLAVLPMPELMMSSLGEMVTEPILFRIPAASLKAFAEFGKVMTQRYGPRAPFCSYILRAQFKTGVDHPQFEYLLVDWLSADNSKLIVELRDSPTAYRILGQTPEGRSTVRAMTADATPVAPTTSRLPPQQSFAKEPQDVDDAATRLAEERAQRIAAVRQGQAQPAAAQPKLIDLQAEDITPPQKAAPPPPQQAAPLKPLADAAADMDALVAAMRPRPPGA